MFLADVRGGKLLQAGVLHLIIPLSAVPTVELVSATRGVRDSARDFCSQRQRGTAQTEATAAVSTPGDVALQP